jgi:hypothetical protein
MGRFVLVDRLPAAEATCIAIAAGHGHSTAVMLGVPSPLLVHSRTLAPSIKLVCNQHSATLFSSCVKTTTGS